MTNHWVDLKNSDLVIVMGGNAAEAHPCGFKWVIEAKKDRKAKLIVVDPRFTRSAAVSDFYAPIRAGSDIAFLGGVINYLLSKDKIHHDYVKNYTNAAFLIDEGFKFEDGLFSGYNAEKRSYGKDTWKYQIGKDGFAMVDPTLQSPNCVFQLMKKHYSRYTPELVSKTTGTPQDAFLKICEMMAETAAPDKTMTICYALGWTEHSVGSQNIRTMALIQLLLGNMGMAGGGINALRGHANVQGITDMCLYSEVLPGYLSAPTDADVDRKTYLEKRTPKAAAAEPDELPAELPEVVHQPAEGLVRGGGDRQERLWLRLAAEEGRRLRRAGDLRAHAPGQDERLLLPGLQPAGLGGEQEEGGRRAGQAEVPGRHRSAGDRHLRVLEAARRVQRGRSDQGRDRGVPPAGQPLRRRDRQLHQLGPRHPVALEGGRRSG
jgi:anaerobic selenocysteine-containing dehydrogenase